MSLMATWAELCRGWTTRAGMAEYADLMAGYPAVIQVYLQLDQQYRKVHHIM